MAQQTTGFNQAVGVAIPAGSSFVIDTSIFPTGGGMTQVVAGTAPAGGVMALVAGHPAKQTEVEGWVCMAGSTLLRRSLKYIIRMAIHAAGGYVCPGQFECCQVVVKGSIRPVGGVVAGFAGDSKSTLVFIFLGMAGVAVRRCTLETLGVAALAGHFHVFTPQLEICQVVVEIRRCPACRGMARPALNPKFTRMGVIHQVAVYTSAGRTSIPIRVAVFTCHAHMFTFQLEPCQAVVELGWLPAFRRMTYAALGPKFPGMGIIG